MTDREGGDQAVIPLLAIAVLAVPVSSHDCLVAAHEGIQPAHALEHFVQGRIFLRGEAGQIQAGQAPAPGEHGAHALNLIGVKAAQINGCQTGAAAEEVCHGSDLRGIKVSAWQKSLLEKGLVSGARTN